MGTPWLLLDQQRQSVCTASRKGRHAHARRDGLPVKGGEIYSGTGLAASAWPTNDGLTMTYVAGPIANFEAIRRDPTAHLIAALDKAGSVGERARGAVQVGPTRATSDLPNLVRAGCGPGWAWPATLDS